MTVRLPDPPSNYDLQYFNQLIRDLEIEINNLKNPIESGYTTSNYTETKDLDASTATLTDVANVLATLIEALKSKGIIDK